MHSVKARECDDSDIAGGGEQTTDIRTDDGHCRADLRGDNGTPVRAIVPGQQVPGQTIAKSEQKEYATHNPGAFARLLVSTPEKNLGHMQDHDADGHAGAPVMQPAHQPPTGNLSEDVAQT